MSRANATRPLKARLLADRSSRRVIGGDMKLAMAILVMLATLRIIVEVGAGLGNEVV